ncbi:MAG: FmdB family zinc ribbon protein [Mycobacteriales bacterium]
MNATRRTICGVPTYSFVCRECACEFDVRRPMSEASAPTPCPDGHHNTAKLLTAVGLAGAVSASASAPAAPGAGGCCGGACGCGR